MGESAGLGNGAGVAVIGGGVCGAGAAAALISASRGRGMTVQVTLFASPSASEIRPPLILTPECRSRLASMGCRVDPEWRALSLEGVEVISSGRRERLTAPSGALWLIEGRHPGESGTELVRQALLSSAALLGARIIRRQVDQVERVRVFRGRRDQPSELAPLAVRFGGKVERFDAAVLATGAGGPLGERFFPGFKPAATLEAVHARLHYPWGTWLGPHWLRLLLDPLRGVDGLFLIPCGRSVHAVAFGAGLTQSDLCQALMVAAREGYLPDGFELRGVRPGRVPFGPGSHLASEGQLAVGPAASGHPFQLGIAESLSSCSRAAIALLDGGGPGGKLERSYVAEGVFELLEDAAFGARALKWLRRAGPRASEAVRRARDRQPGGSCYSPGVLGLSSPTARSLFRTARGLGLRELFRSLFLSPPSPGPTPLPEPNLYFVVDDHPPTREALTEYLRARGAQVVAFSDELSLFAAAAQRPPAVILLDVVLPWVDGLQLCEGLKQHPLTRTARVLVMSGLDRPHIRARAIEAGAEAFLAKPFPPALLWALLTGEAPPSVSPVREGAKAAPGTAAR